MYAVKVSFNFPEEVYKLLKEEIPSRSRSAYVASTLKENLNKKRATRTFDESYGVLKNTGPKEWNNSKSTVKWIRTMRAKDQKSLEKLWI